MKNFVMFVVGLVVGLVVGGAVALWLHDDIMGTTAATPAAATPPAAVTPPAPATSPAPTFKDSVAYFNKALPMPTKVKWQTKSKKLVVDDDAPDHCALQVADEKGYVLGVVREKRPMALPKPFDTTKPYSVNWYYRDPNTLLVIQGPRLETIQDVDE